MSKMIFVNLPVTALDRSIGFYRTLGAVKDDRFCDGSAAMITVSPEIHVMLLTRDRFSQFTTRQIADTRTTVQTLLCLSADSRADVDTMVEKAVSAGGVADPSPVQDHGFMYGRSFEDPDGHIWEVAWMDVAAAMAAAGKTAAE